jgi:hypothetical protein
MLSVLLIGYQTMLLVSLDKKRGEQTQIETQVAREAGIEKSLDVFVQVSSDLPVNQYELLADDYIQLKSLIPLYDGHGGTRIAINEDILVRRYYSCLNYIINTANTNNEKISWVLTKIENGELPDNRCNNLDFTNQNNHIPMLKFLNSDTTDSNINQSLITDINRTIQDNEDHNLKQIETIRRTFRENYLEGSDKVMSIAMLRQQSNDRLASKHHFLRVEKVTHDQSRAILMDSDILHLGYDVFKAKFNENRIDIINIANEIVEQVYLAREKKSYNQDATNETIIIQNRLIDLKQEFGL